MIQELRRFHHFIRSHPVASRDLVAAWRRWIGWQLRSRIASSAQKMQWIGGSCLIVERGMTGATGNLYCGLHEFRDMALLLHYFGAGGGTLLDLGANIGSYTILAAKVRGAEVVAVEPVPTTFNHLLRNVDANGVGHLVRAHQAAIGAEDGEIGFSVDQDTTNHIVDEDYAGASAQVRVTTVPKLVGSEVPGFWKIDVEGMEDAVLVGAEEVLGDPHVEVLLLEGINPASSELLHRLGFRFLGYDPFERRFLEQPNAGNQLWVRRSAALLDRCRSSPSVDVWGLSI